MGQHADLAAVVGFVAEHIGEHGRARRPRAGPTVALKFLDAAVGKSVGEHLRAERRALCQGMTGLLLGAASAIQPRRKLQVRRRQTKPLAADVVDVGENGGDGASLGAGELGSPGARVEMLEQELVDAIVDRERLLHALAQIRSSCGSGSGHGIPRGTRLA